MTESQLSPYDRIVLESDMFDLAWLLNELRSNDYALTHQTDKIRAKSVLSRTNGDIIRIIESSDVVTSKRKLRNLFRRK